MVDKSRGGPIMVRSWLLGVIILICILAYCSYFALSGQRDTSTTHLYYRTHGQVTDLTGKTGSNAVISSSEEAIVSSDDPLLLGVSSDMIDQLKRDETSIEVVYPNTREFEIGQKYKRQLNIKRLLIPLTGVYAVTADKSERVTIFYGTDGYESGPYSNSGDYRQNLIRSLAQMGYTTF